MAELHNIDIRHLQIATGGYEGVLRGCFVKVAFDLQNVYFIFELISPLHNETEIEIYIYIFIYLFNSPAFNLTSSAPISTRISGYIHNINTNIQYNRKLSRV